MTTYECTEGCDGTFSTMDSPEVCPFCGEADVDEHEFVPKSSRI